MVHDSVIAAFHAEGFTGFTTLPGCVRFRDGTLVEEYKQLVVTGWGGFASPQPGMHIKKDCPECGRKKLSHDAADPLVLAHRAGFQFRHYAGMAQQLLPSRTGASARRRGRNHGSVGETGMNAIVAELLRQFQTGGASIETLSRCLDACTGGKIQRVDLLPLEGPLCQRWQSLRQTLELLQGDPAAVEWRMEDEYRPARVETEYVVQLMGHIPFGVVGRWPPPIWRTGSSFQLS